jgi:hypothetical protein
MATCRLLITLCGQPTARGALDSAALIPALVDLIRAHHLLSTALAINATWLLCQLSPAHADAVVRCQGLHCLLETLENSTVAKAQRHALVAATHVLAHATPAVVSPVLQTGTAVSVAALVMYHTGSGPVRSYILFVVVSRLNSLVEMHAVAIQIAVAIAIAIAIAQGCALLRAHCCSL